MVRFLSREWFDLLRSVGEGAPERPGASARVQCTVTGAPDGDVTFHLVVDDGRLLVAEPGPDPDDPPLALTGSYDVAVAVARGELDPSAAFMQGRIKATGDMSQLFALLPLMQGADAAEMLHRVAAETEL
ncbi:MAG TPA: SCP2 sterol-binding domain-containing protein [Acidimicrobiales bacterium]